MNFATIGVLVFRLEKLTALQHLRTNSGVDATRWLTYTTQRETKQGVHCRKGSVGQTSHCPQGAAAATLGPDWAERSLREERDWKHAATKMLFET